MTIGVTGASGFIGSALIAECLTNSDRVIGYSRNPDNPIGGCVEVRELPTTGYLNLEGTDALVHLAGESIMGLWSADKKKAILESRVNSTQQIIDSLFKMDAEQRPKILACASGVGIYGNRADDRLDEESDAGFGFLADVCKQWESIAMKAEDFGVRVVLLRIGFVLGKNGGAIPMLEKVFGKGLGGKLGDGKQWMPWIHIDDVAGIAYSCLKNDEIRGPVNVCSPNPVTNSEFTKKLASAMGKSAILPVPGLVLKSLPGGMREIFLNSLRVEPIVMKSISYNWEYSDLEEALQGSLEA